MNGAKGIEGFPPAESSVEALRANADFVLGVVVMAFGAGKRRFHWVFISSLVQNHYAISCLRHAREICKLFFRKPLVVFWVRHGTRRDCFRISEKDWGEGREGEGSERDIDLNEAGAKRAG